MDPVNAAVRAIVDLVSHYRSRDFDQNGIVDSTGNDSVSTPRKVMRGLN